MNIGIVGTRRRNDFLAYTKIKTAFLSTRETDCTIISGGCPKGGDRFAEILSVRFDVPIRIFHANWNKFGKAAGFVRNTDIAKNCDKLIACVAKDRTGGTEDTIKKFLKINTKDNLILV